MVLPQRLRDEITTTPGEVLVRPTPDGLLITPLDADGVVSTGTDGLPVLHVGSSVSNDEVLAALDRERAER